MNESLLYHNKNYFTDGDEKCKHTKGISLQRNASQSRVLNLHQLGSVPEQGSINTTAKRQDLLALVTTV